MNVLRSRRLAALIAVLLMVAAVRPECPRRPAPERGATVCAAVGAQRDVAQRTAAVADLPPFCFLDMLPAASALAPLACEPGRVAPWAGAPLVLRI